MNCIILFQLPFLSLTICSDILIYIASYLFISIAHKYPASLLIINIHFPRPQPQMIFKIN